MSLSGRSICGSHHRADGAFQRIHPRVGRHPAAFDVQLGHPLVVAPEAGEEVVGQVALVGVAERADDAEVERDVAAEGAGSRLTWMLPGCMSAWKKPSRKTCVKKIDGAVARQLRQVDAGGAQAVELADGHAVHALHDHDAGCAQVPHHLGHQHQVQARPCCGAAGWRWRPRAPGPARRAGRRRTRPPPRAASGAGRRPTAARPSRPAGAAAAGPGR